MRSGLYFVRIVFYSVFYIIYRNSMKASLLHNRQNTFKNYVFYVWHNIGTSLRFTAQIPYARIGIVIIHTQTGTTFPICGPPYKKRRQKAPPRLPACVPYSWQQKTREAWILLFIIREVAYWKRNWNGCCCPKEATPLISAALSTFWWLWS